MTRQDPSPTAGVADEFEARAATLRRLAADLRNPEDRAELLRIAGDYDQDAARLRNTGLTRT